MFPELQLTADGSHTLFLSGMNEHYHSVNGAIQESKHVFIDAGLKQSDKKAIRILEFGFGTGLNALLSCLEGEKRDISIHYTSLEKYPLPLEIIEKLNYSRLLSPESEELFLKIHRCDWNQSTPVTPLFSIEKIETDFSDYDFGKAFDIVYYDAFAPDKQAGVWSLELFGKIYKNMNCGGIMTTYCAKGEIRRMMKEAGFIVERIPGPPGKRQMLRAFKELH